MKILFVTNHYLDTTGGGSFASRSFANAFAEISTDCLLIYPDRGNDISKLINNKYKTKGVKYKKIKLLKLIDIYIGRINRFYNTILNIVNDYNPDIVVFDNSQCSFKHIRKIKNLGKKIITIHHNYQMEYHNGTNLNCLIKYPFLYYMKKAEKESVLLSNLNLTLTDNDIELLYSNYDKNHTSSIYRLGCFESEINKIKYPTNKKYNNKIYFSITGTLESSQTDISITNFLKYYFPIIIERYPQSHLIISGRNPSKILHDFCYKNNSNITLIANPSDMQDILDMTDIYICPVFLGGGLKIRVMDGLKNGIPSLVHKVSARGYENFKKKECLFDYEDIETFTNSLDNLVSRFLNKNFNRDKTMEIYSNEFSFEAGVNRLKCIIDNITE